MDITGKQVYDAIMQAAHEQTGITDPWQPWAEYVQVAIDEQTYIRAAEILSEQT